MKNIIKASLAVIAVLMLCFAFAACEAENDIGTEIIDETTVEETTAEVIETDDVSVIEHNGKNWSLTFSDEFDGEDLDTTKWEYLPDQIRDTCTWTGDAAYFEDGNMILAVESGNEPYHAGAIRSMGKFEQAYGYFELKCKVPTISGVNAAFWLMGGSMWTKEQEGGIDGAEIDILETNGLAENKFQHAIHWDGYAEFHDSVHNPVTNKKIYDGEYHVFGFEWTEEEYIFYVDGDETWRTTAGGICTAPLYLKLTVATGGWVGDPDPNKLPTEAMVIDYVRVYEEIK